MLAEAERERRHGRSSESADKPRMDRPHPGAHHVLGRREHCRAAPALAPAQPDRRLASSTPTTSTPHTRRRSFARCSGSDFEKHRFWLIVNALLFVGSGVFFFVPGPNIVAYYFAFRVVGHYFSMQGARQGLSVAEWRTEGSAPLTELRRVIALGPADREQRVQDVALRLRLEHLATFFERTAVLHSQAS